MGLLTPKDNKNDKGSSKGSKFTGGKESEFIRKPGGKANNHVKKQGIPGAKRGS